MLFVILTHTFNKRINRDKILEERKMARVTPIYKKETGWAVGTI
jgi:hypothetical protein